MKRALFFLFISLLLLGCNGNHDKKYSDKPIEVTRNDPATQREFDYDYDFDSSSISNDTLKLFSFSNYFYECFGKFRDPNNLIRSFTKKDFKVSKESGDDIYRVESGESFLKYIFIDEDKKMDLVSGKIKTQNFVMTNGLRVGLTKTEVENILFPEKRHSLEKVNKVQIITALLGLWINLNFEGEILKKIEVDSDYQVDKS